MRLITVFVCSSCERRLGLLAYQCTCELRVPSVLRAGGHVRGCRRGKHFRGQWKAANWLILLRPQAPPGKPLPRMNTKEGDQDAYATSDIVVPHPTQPGRWKIVARADEQIVLSNGEKVRHVWFDLIIRGNDI